MSLIGLTVFEIAMWVAFNRNIPFSTARTTIALGTTSAAATLSWLYLEMWSLVRQQPLIDLYPILVFSLTNAALSLGIAFVGFTYHARSRA